LFGLRFDFGSALRVVASVLAIAGSSYGLYAKFVGFSPAIDPKEFKFQAEKGVVIFEIDSKGAIPKPKDIQGAISIKMTTKAVVIAWRENLRTDCFLVSRSTGIRNLAGLDVPLHEFSGATLQGTLGDAVALIPIKVPSDLVPGKYTAYNDETYKCGEAVSVYNYPKVEIYVRY
jgi:hypothetical protein